MTEHELDTLLRDYGGAVRSVCRAILPGHPQDAEEAEADTFYKLWRGAHLPADETHRRRLVVQAARRRGSAPLTATVRCCAGARRCRWMTATTPSWPLRWKASWKPAS